MKRKIINKIIKIIKKIIKIIIYFFIIIILIIVVYFAQFAILSNIFTYRYSEKKINSYNYYLNNINPNKLKILDQSERKDELLSYYIYDNKYQLIIWEYKDKDVISNIHINEANYKNKINLKKVGENYNSFYVSSNPGYGLNFYFLINFSTDIYLKYEINETILSHQQTKYYYSINYYSDHITIGSSKKETEIIFETFGDVKTNLVILNKKGKLVFIFASALNGVEPIKDNFLFDIIKPELLQKGLK